MVRMDCRSFWKIFQKICLNKENYNKDRRVQRGLFQAKDMLINADVNGSLQIMRKVFPDSLTGYGIEVDLTPTIINAVKTA